MTLKKNRFPHDFKAWHDIRTDEYAKARQKMKEAEQKACKVAVNTIKKKAFKQELRQIKPDVSLQIADSGEEDDDTP